MPLCGRLPVASECCLNIWDTKLCFECGETMPSDPKMAAEFLWANYFIVITLFIISIWNIISFIRVYNNNNNYISMMRLSNILYAFGTGLFGICRVHFEFSKPLLICAAIHNLCEWVFVCYAFYKNKEQRQHVILYSIIWIFIVIGVVLLMVPTFPYYALPEQITGISLDFMLPIVWFILWRQNKQHKELKSIKSTATCIYFIGLIAHCIHILFTILPLVIVNFIKDQNEFLSRSIEFMIFLSVPITHILYTIFTDLFEKHIDLPSNGQFDDIYQVSIPEFGKNSSQIIKMLFWYLLCVGIGLFPILIIPQSLPECDAISNVIESNNFIIGTSTAYVYEGMSESFEYYIQSKNLIENARNFKGNIFFYFNKDIFNPNRYFFVEAWESRQAAETWIKSEFDRAVFNNNTYNMLIGGKLEIAGYLPLKPWPVNNNNNNNNNVGKGAIRYVFKPFNGCTDVGEKMLTLNNCEWIANCDHVKVINEEKREQILVFKNGWELHCFAPKPKKEINGDEIIYSMIHQCDNGITEHFQLISDQSKYPKNQCHALLKFDVDLNIKTVDQVYTMYNTLNIPHVQKTYQLINKSNESIESNESMSCNL